MISLSSGDINYCYFYPINTVILTIASVALSSATQIDNINLCIYNQIMLNKMTIFFLENSNISNSKSNSNSIK